MIGADKSSVDLWKSAGGIIAAAEKTGKVDADAPLRLKALVDAQPVALVRNAEDAKAGGWTKLSRLPEVYAHHGRRVQQ